MKSVQRFTAALLACCCAVLSCIRSEYSSLRADAIDEQAIKTAEIVINTVNDIRVSYGLPELATTPLLLEVTAERSKELTYSMDHLRPDGTKCFTILKSAGLSYFSAAENLAAGRSDPVSTVQQWMQSDGHRKNILGESYTHIGVACHYDPDAPYSYYWGMFLIGVYDGNDPHIYDDQYIPGRELGDVNGTHAVNATDAAVILQYAATTASGEKYPVVRAFANSADVNSDGAVNAVDASIILTYAVNKATGKDCQLEDFIW